MPRDRIPDHLPSVCRRLEHFNLVQARDTDSYWDRHWGCFIQYVDRKCAVYLSRSSDTLICSMPAVERLVPDLDWLRSREDIWKDHIRADREWDRAGAPDIMGHKETQTAQHDEALEGNLRKLECRR